MSHVTLSPILIFFFPFTPATLASLLLLGHIRVLCLRVCALAVPADRILFAHLSICLTLSFSSDLYSNVPFSMMLSLLTLYKWPGCLLPLTSNIIYSSLLFSFLIAPTSCEIVNDLFAGYFCLSLLGRGERGRNPVLILFYSLIYPR